MIQGLCEIITKLSKEKVCWENDSQIAKAGS